MDAAHGRSLRQAGLVESSAKGSLGKWRIAWGDSKLGQRPNVPNDTKWARRCDEVFK